MVSSGAALNIKLEDKISGALFANCPVEAYPGVAIEPVSDSSRYFVLRIQDDNGRSAFIGVGFGVSFDGFKKVRRVSLPRPLAGPIGLV